MKRSLTIAMPTPSFLPNRGGMEIGLHNIASRLAARGHKPCVIMPTTHYNALKRERYILTYDIAAFWPKMSAITEAKPAAGLLLHSLFFKLYQQRHRPDVWHSTMIYPTGTGLSYGLGGHIPALARAAGNDIQINHDARYGTRRDPRVDEIIRKWGCDLPAYVAITDTVRHEYESLGIPVDKIYSIPNGVELERFQKVGNRLLLQKKYGIPTDAFLFLSIGRNHPKKNYSSLIEATRLLQENCSSANIKVAIIGDDSSMLDKQVKQAGLKDTFYLLEGIGLSSENKENIRLPADDLIDLYKGADAFVFPSLIETFGIAIIEAMAAGLPCVVSDAPGCRDITSNGFYALSFPPQDIQSLARQMEKVFQNSDIRLEYQKKSLDRAQSFDWDHIVDQYEDLYFRLIDEQL